MEKITNGMYGRRVNIIGVSGENAGKIISNGILRELRRTTCIIEVDGGFLEEHSAFGTLANHIEDTMMLFDDGVKNIQDNNKVLNQIKYALQRNLYNKMYSNLFTRDMRVFIYEVFNESTSIINERIKKPTFQLSLATFVECTTLQTLQTQSDTVEFNISSCNDTQFDWYAFISPNLPNTCILRNYQLSVKTPYRTRMITKELAEKYSLENWIKATKDVIANQKENPSTDINSDIDSRRKNVSKEN